MTTKQRPTPAQRRAAEMRTLTRHALADLDLDAHWQDSAEHRHAARIIRAARRWARARRAYRDLKGSWFSVERAGTALARLLGEEGR